ncbi:MAG: class I SAM-dependent methyltransferase [Deltaproteobacteria bacterium]|nr:class I SAM-dependent methyltransferase [Deltaproteobacteria bacterium]
MDHDEPRPASLLLEHLHLFKEKSLEGPVLDLACGNGHNGIFLAAGSIPVHLCDVSEEALTRARELAEKRGVKVQALQKDLEQESINPLPEETYGAILVFRYLHRPLFPSIRKALKPGGILIYETFTVDQPRFGKPRNPAFLLKPGELREQFKEWEIIHYFEGILTNPDRAVAQIVCQKKAKNNHENTKARNII